jgi:recombination protein RecT
MATQAVANRQDNPIVALNNQLESRAEQFRMVLPQHISPDKFQRTILTAVQNDPALLDADRQSLLLACMKCAQDGLLPDKREAALVIFKENKNVNGQWQTKLLVQYMPMVYGLRKKILQSGEVSDIFTQVVYRQEIENGNFLYEEGTERMLRHKPILDPDFEPNDDDLVLAYSIATFKDGSKSFEVMRRSEIQKVQEKSQTGATRDRKGNPRTPSGPWVEWKSEQWRKTVMRRHSKSLPMSGDLIDIEAREQKAKFDANQRGNTDAAE